jgi:hypothetical protein
MSKFIRTIENFTCEHCGSEVKGNGFTNHCPNCLWSKHVDIHPGDRSADCGGLMEPIAIEPKGQDYIIIHKCQKCGVQKKNIASKQDSFETMLKLIPKDLP